MSNSTTNSVAVLCEEARLLAAGKLAAIVDACATKASDESDPSVQHARFVLEIAQLEAVSGETKKLSAQEKADNGDNETEDGVSDRKSLAQIFLDRLNELRVDPVK